MWVQGHYSLAVRGTKGRLSSASAWKTSGCTFLLILSFYLVKEMGVTAFGNRKKHTFFLFNHLHSPGITTLAASSGNQKCTNCSGFSQWVALNGTLANGIKTTTKLSNNKLGKLRAKINPVQASKTGKSGTAEETEALLCWAGC